MLPSDLALAARSLLLDSAAAVAIERLGSEAIACILLKGATIASWLYEANELRPYIDVDLLVSPRDFHRATEVLAGLGYRHWLAGADAAELGPKERELFGPDGVCIDLHLGFLGVPDAPQRCWDILSGHTVEFTLGRAVVRVLDLDARTMHLALHAAQNGPVDVKAMEDLARGVARVGHDRWRAAAELAHELGATEAFAAGLRLVPAGEVLADQLSLPHRMTIELALRVCSAPQEAIFFERLRATVGARRKAALVARKLFPTATYLRASVPLARRGVLGLLAAEAIHPWSVARRTVPAAVAWSRARSVAKGRAEPSPEASPFRPS